MERIRDDYNLGIHEYDGIISKNSFKKLQTNPEYNPKIIDEEVYAAFKDEIKENYMYYEYGKAAFDFRENSIVVTIPFSRINAIVGDKVSDKVGDKSLNTTRQRIIKEIRNNPNIYTPSIDEYNWNRKNCDSKQYIILA